MSIAITEARTPARAAQPRKATSPKAVRQASSTCTEAPPLWTAQQAAHRVLARAARNFEEARALFESLEFGYRAGGESDHALGFYAELALGQAVEAEQALVNAILAADHCWELSPKDNYLETRHEPRAFRYDGRVYEVIPDPDQDLEIGESSAWGPAMVLRVRDEPAPRRPRS